MTTFHRAVRAGVAGLLLAVALLPASAAFAQVPSAPWRGPSDLRLEVLSTATQDPTAIDVAPDGRVIWAERKGAVKVLLRDGQVVDAGRLAVAANECADCPDNLNEGGLH